MYRYRIGQRSYKKPSFFTIIGIILIICGLLGLVAFLFRGTPTITNTHEVVKTIGTGQGPPKTFDEKLFTIQLPADWQVQGQADDSSNQYNWHSTKQYQDNRTLNIYVDDIPKSFAINRLLPIQVEGNHINPSTVSDNCADFTGGKNNVAAQSEPDTMAKWAGINFICDLSHYNRNATGTGTAGAINTATIKGPTTGTHKFFFVYTDHNIDPNYTIFYDALQSFVLK